MNMRKFSREHRVPICSFIQSNTRPNTRTDTYRERRTARPTVAVMQTLSPIPDALRDELRARVDSSNAVKVAKEIGVPLSTMMRALVGLPVRRGTVALVRVGLAETRAA